MLSPCFAGVYYPSLSPLWFQLLTVESRGAQEYRHSASRDSPTSDLLYNSLLLFIRVKYSTKFKCTWITSIPCKKLICSGILALPCLYRRMKSLGILLLMLGSDCLSSVIPGWICNENSLPLLREKLQLSPHQKLPVSYVFLRSAPHYPRIWDHKLVSDVSAPPDFRHC